jgi:hypothetical protein
MGLRVKGLEFRVSDLGLKLLDSGFRSKCLRCRV